MGKQERILRPAAHIHGGITLPHHKRTAEMPTEILPYPKQVIMPLSQHIGKPSKPIVTKGDTVFVGTKIAEADGFISVPLHAGVSGTVTAVGDTEIGGKKVPAIVIESDGAMQPDPNLAPFAVKTAADVAEAAKCCGLVGLGGAGFPTHVKLTPNPDRKIDTLIVNGAECEPYLTADYRECLEGNVIDAVYLLKEKLGLEQVIIGVEGNKPKAIEKLYRIACDHCDADNRVRLMRLPTDYPQGAEKVIVYSATGRAIPPGKLPADVGCIVMNITSISALYRFITTGMPLVEKRITLEGDAIGNPKNIIAPIGTPIRNLLDFAGIHPEGDVRVIFGGPMMGNPAATADAVIEKRTNGILIMKAPKPVRQTACIHCGRCIAKCPMGLYPTHIEAAYHKGLNDRLADLGVMSCMECGSCSYICPAKRPLTQVMRAAKTVVRRNVK